ncbi:MAG: hypothetical protein IPF88_15755 [Candidatus Microthrix sp.]|nr:hypothetical protein [Candidatus Microthrix sp.]MBK6439975.1 hypothetical protein [Candidatus Microthrix sp.]
MTPPETDPNDPADESPDAPLAGGALVRRRIGMALATLGVLAIVLMWVAAFNGWGSTDSVDQLSDTQWTKQANAVCTKWRDEFDTLPAASDAKTPQDRAASVEDSIDILTDMTDELAALEPPPDPTEASLVTAWLGDWDRHIEDRQRFVDVLESGRKGLPVHRVVAGQEAGQPLHRPLRQGEQHGGVRHPRRHLSGAEAARLRRRG